MFYSHDLHVLQYCDGTNWIAAGSVPGLGDTGTMFLNGQNAANVLGQADFTHNTPSTTQAGLSHPGGSAAWDAVHKRLFVADTSNNRVLVYDLGGGITDGMNASYVLGQSNFTSSGTATSQAGMYSPEDVAWDAVNNRLFVADYGNSRVLVYDLSGGISDGMNAAYELGQPDFSSNTGAATQSGMNLPSGVSYDSVHNRLFVGDYLNSRVLVYDLSGGITDGMNAVHVLGEPNFTTSTGGTSQSLMYISWDVAYDAANNRLFVSDRNNRRVLVYDLSGGITDGMNAAYVLGQSNFSSNGDATTQSGMSLPQGLSWDAANNRLFVADLGNNRVLIYDLSNGIINGMNAAHVLGQSSFTSKTAAISQSGMIEPGGIALDAANNRLFVTDYMNSRVTVFNGSDGDMCSNITNGLVGWWKFDDGSGGTAADSSGHGNTGTLTGSPTWTKGWLHGALRFNGTHTQYVDVGNASDLNFDNNQPFSLAAWVYVTPDTNGNTILSKMANSGNFPGFYFDVDGTNKGLELFMCGTASGCSGGDNISVGTSVNTLKPSAWHHVTLTYDGSSKAAGVKFYIDGVSKTVGIGQDNLTSSILSPGDMIIGINPPGAGQTFNGLIDDVRIYNRALSATEIKQLYDKWGNEGDMLYNHDEHVFQYCDGTDWRAEGPVPGAGSQITDGENAASVLGQSNFTANSPATTRSGMTDPFDSAWDAAHERLFVADYGNSRVLAYDLGGGITDGMNASHVMGQINFTSNTGATTQSGMKYPYAVAWDNVHARLFVTDDLNNRLLEYDLSSGITDGMDASHVLGQIDFTSSTATASQAGMSSPWGVAYDSINNRLFLTDGGNNRVLEYDLSGGISDGMNATHVLGQPAFTSNSNNRGGGTTPAQNSLSAPAGVVYDPVNSRLYVADSGNDRVLEYDLSGGITDGMNATHVLGQPDFISHGANATQSGMGGVKGLAYDSANGRLFIADGEFSRVLVYDLNGGITDGMNASHVLGETGYTAWSPSAGQSGMNFPGGLSYDVADDRLFVGDTFNHRTLIFNLACANPVGGEGDLFYNSDHNVMQYCNGQNWIGIGK